MFPKGYFCNELFAPRYFPKFGAVIIAPPVTESSYGGSVGPPPIRRKRKIISGSSAIQLPAFELRGVATFDMDQIREQELHFALSFMV